MRPDVVSAYIAYLLSADGKWPLPWEAPILRHLNTWAAIREGDVDALRTVAGWTDARKRYRVDPLGERIADAWAHYLVGDEPMVRPADDADAELMADLIEVNEFASELERAAVLCVSEGEIWPRIYVDPVAAPRPLLDWVSRRNIVPQWLGVRLAAAGIFTELVKPKNAPDGAVYRHVEIHTPGLVTNVLFLGTNDKLGDEVDLDSHTVTAGLLPAWQTGISGFLIGRVPNRLRSDRRIGVSDYAGILDTLLDLNEATIIGAHNARLTARKRAVISASVVRPSLGDGELTPEERPNGASNPPAARFDSAEEVFLEDPLDGELGRDRSDPFRIIEYSFDAASLIEWQRHLVETAITRVGLAAQYLGAGSGADGYAISGTALRLRLIPTDKTGRGKARYWDDALPRILSTMAQLDAAPVEGRGFARSWSSADQAPTVDRGAGLPEDELEEAQRHSYLVNAGIESIETAVRELHPDWDEAKIGDEVKRIRDDRAAGAASSFPMGA